MPRVNRKPKKRSEGYTADHAERLLTGFYLEDCPFGDDDEALREGWILMRDRLLPEFIKATPVKRPWAWWRFDAPERRQRIDNIIHPFDDPKRKDHIELVALSHPSFRDRAYELSYGVPSCLIGGFQDEFDARYEGELHFLDRHGLLTPFERCELYGEPLPASEVEPCQE